jgi:hypothetical protein
MFITLKYPIYKEQIPILSTFKFTKSNNQESYKITLSELFAPRDFVIKNVVMEVTQES